MKEQLLRTFNFEVELRRSSGSGSTLLGTGGFQECSGLEIELDIQELQEGGRNDGVIRRVGRARYQPLTLKRGMFYQEGGGAGGLDRSIWKWLQGIASGAVPVSRYDGSVRVLERGEPIATWSFVRGLPSRIAGPQLNAKSGEVAIEELVIAHEGLQLEDG